MTFQRVVNTKIFDLNRAVTVEVFAFLSEPFSAAMFL